jgi:hypothetical protein
MKRGKKASCPGSKLTGYALAMPNRQLLSDRKNRGHGEIQTSVFHAWRRHPESY